MQLCFHCPNFSCWQMHVSLPVQAYWVAVHACSFGVCPLNQCTFTSTWQHKQWHTPSNLSLNDWWILRAGIYLMLRTLPHTHHVCHMFPAFCWHVLWAHHQKSTRHMCQLQYQQKLGWQCVQVFMTSASLLSYQYGGTLPGRADRAG